MIDLGVPNRKRQKLFDRTLLARQIDIRIGNISAAIGVADDVCNGMLENQRVQSDGGAEDGNNFKFSLKPVDLEEGVWRGARDLLMCQHLKWYRSEAA